MAAWRWQIPMALLFAARGAVLGGFVGALACSGRRRSRQGAIAGALLLGSVAWGAFWLEAIEPPGDASPSTDAAWAPPSEGIAP